MKKILLCALPIMGILFSACQQTGFPNEPGNLDPTDIVYASIEDAADTKTCLDGEKVLWSSGDEILAFIGKNLRRKYVVSAESVGTSEGSFIKDADYEHIGSSSPISHNVAFYPFSELICKADGESYVLEGISLPSVQTYVADSFDPGSFPMMAVSADTDDVDFRFKNLCGVLKLQLTGCMPVQSITVTGNSGEVLAGSATVASAYNDEPELTMSSDGHTSVTLECYGVQLDEDAPVSFLISLPPTVFTNGFTVTVKDTWGGYNSFVTSKKNEITRSGILKMPVRECVREPQEGDYIDEYGNNCGPGVRMGQTFWAPVNCGYHKKDFKYGKLYQWGRKYGQGYNGALNNVDSEYLGQYADASVPDISQGPVTLLDGQSYDNADLFYVGAPEFNYDWVYQQNGRLWNAGTESVPVKTEYDPCPSGWRVPTYSEYEELLGFSKVWYGNNNYYGGLFVLLYSSPSSSTYSQIELIAAGNLDRSDAQSYNRGSHGCYWTSSGDDIYSNNVYFFRTYLDLCYDSFGRADGYSVRCVKDDRELIPVESITLDKTTFTIEAGCTEYLSASVLPTNANNQFAHWWSDKPQIATVDKYGNVTGIAEGVTVITAMAGMQVATCEVTVTQPTASEPLNRDYVDEYGINHGQGVEIDGVVWAPVNCGYHETDFKYGKLYQWGRKYGQGYSGHFYDVAGSIVGTYSDATVPLIESGPVSLATGQSDSNSNVFYTSYSDYNYDWLSSQNDKLWNSGTEESPVKTEYDPCPVSWRVPTYAELNQLWSNRSSLTTDENGQVGYWFNGVCAYTSEVLQVFFPTAGYCYDDGAADRRGDYGLYWSSRPYGSNAYSLFFSSNTNMTNSSRVYGFSVRCVQE